MIPSKTFCYQEAQIANVLKSQSIFLTGHYLHFSLTPQKSEGQKWILEIILFPKVVPTQKIFPHLQIKLVLIKM